ncbi:Disulfide bond formation protein B [wastewater metagenome]|uniref:Disulfide bond formation protein B n=2 Tax=unclassified sequences TaxID=12908 RepID=A0A5B8R940_9ZZZZ|nr:MULTISPECIES: disulfide bond formation protein B [Arhodomonas]MCS4502627.1 disulfide bond formation protein B [Arhodomonas aquaeolei]QEA05276.1 disulfide bond formation protein B [uncultured organism]
MTTTLVEHRRGLNLLGFGFCAALLAFAVYLEHVQGLEPCPLCIFQRVTFAALGLVLLVAGLHAPRRGGGRVYAVLGLIIAAAGVGLALRHLWLQSLPPDQVPACGPGLNYMLETFPPMQALQMVLSGSGECAEVDRILGVSIPAWTLVAFVLTGIGGVLVNWPARRR